MKKIILIPFFLLLITACSSGQEKRLIEKNTNLNLKNTEAEFVEQINSVKNNKKYMQKTIDPKSFKDLSKTYKQAVMKTNMGDIIFEFYAEESPKTVNNFLNLAESGFYNGVKFHRVIKDFMVQAGDPLSKDENSQMRWGTGGPGYSFEDEFNDKKLVEGSLAMANSGPNTNGSQFFIVTISETPWLDGRHTNFGKVVEGLDIVKKIEAVETEGPDRPVNDVVIENIQLK